MGKKISLLKKILATITVIVIIISALIAWYGYKVIFHANVDLKGKSSIYMYIPTGSEYQDVLDTIYNKNIIINPTTFEWLADRKNLVNNIHPGRYQINDGMGNNELIDLLRSASQKPLMLTLNNLRTIEQLAGHISKYIEADSLSIISKLNDSNAMSKYDLTPQKSKLMFLPNTYEFFWNTSASQLLDRMHTEYQRFWNDARQKQCETINMTREEVSILASIVQLETNKRDEMAKIAGVYMNRLKRNMTLQSCPTVIYAIGDFSITRVLNKHLDVDSPYNTYKNQGLPPGPITMPEPFTIDQVLNYEKHNYLYFSAKEDFSGYHNFSKTYSQHLSNARRYQQALNEKRIMN